MEHENSAISRILLYPTVIEEYQARRARQIERQAIVARMRRLCAKLHTETQWNDQAGFLEIPVKPYL
jgi:poly-gamma-glutamate synthesis protein (capsule biosynthesis protein)